MEKTIKNPFVFEESKIPGLPDLHTTSSGATFDPRSDQWNYRDGIDDVEIGFSIFRGLISDDLITILKAILMHSSSELAASSVMALHYSLIKFFHSISDAREVTFILKTHVVEFWKNEKVDRYKADMRNLFIRWQKHGYPCIQSDALLYAKSQKIAYRSGVSVLTWCPVKGPLTNVEFEATYKALLEAYGSGEISQPIFLMTWLTTSLGLRPRQIALLKVADFVEAKNDGFVVYSLNVTRIKQQSQSLRDELYTWKLIPEIGDIFSAQAKSSLAYFKDLLANPLDAPLFFRSDLEPFFVSLDKEAANDVELEDNEDCEPEVDEFGEGYDYHLSAQSISGLIRSGFDKLDVNSERVGNNIRLNAARMRKTYGTRLAAEGRPPSVIAMLLTHRSIRSSGPYIAATSGLQHRLDKALAFELAPLAQAFQGKLLIDWNDDAESSVVRDLRVAKSADPLGKCGKHGFCGFAAPIACYTCKKFRPWLDGPHTAVFDFLWKKRELRAAKKIKNDANMVMLHDRSIIAVAQVIIRCDEFRRGKQ